MGHSRSCKRTFWSDLQWEVKNSCNNAKARVFAAEVDYSSTSSFICLAWWSMTWTCTEACSGAALFPCVKRMGGRRGWSWEEPWTSAWWWHWTSAEKPKISNVCTCRTEQVHLPSYLNSGKPQNDRENMPSSGCAEHMGQQLIILVWMWGTQYFSTDGEATIIQILTRNIFKKNQNNFSAFLGLFYCIHPPPFFFFFCCKPAVRRCITHGRLVFHPPYDWNTWMLYNSNKNPSAIMGDYNVGHSNNSNINFS